MKRIHQLLLFTFLISQLSVNAQSQDLFLKIWKRKDNTEAKTNSNSKLESFNKALESVKHSIKEKEKLYYDKNDVSVKKDLLDLYKRKHHLINDIVKNSIEENDLYLFYSLIQHVNYGHVKLVKGGMSLDAEDSQIINLWAKSISRTALGSKVPELHLQLRNGKMLKLSELKGKYVWIDSWASKCVPCIAKLKRMKPVYEKHHKQNFEILALSWDYNKSGFFKSLTEAKTDWEKAIDRFQFNWPNVFDENDAIMGGIFASVGKNILIDPEGKIVGFDLKPLELEAILNK